jgi:hypothetical protein
MWEMPELFFLGDWHRFAFYGTITGYLDGSNHSSCPCIVQGGGDRRLKRSRFIDDIADVDEDEDDDEEEVRRASCNSIIIPFTFISSSNCFFES